MAERDMLQGRTDQRGGWRFWIDRGGTFTDLVGRAPDGHLVVRKVLSRQPERPGDPAIRALREVLSLPPGSALPAGLVQEVRLGTTVATNALLERQAEPVLLFVNRGFADLPTIGDQHRPDLFALRIERPRPLDMRVIEVDGRLAPDGEEIEPLRLDERLEEEVRQALADGYHSCAVALLHAYREGAHERQLGAWLERHGLRSVLLSHRVSGRTRLVPRLSTTVVEAALRPVLGDYLDAVQDELGPRVRLRVMTSAGVLQSPPLLQAKDTILSGPAGGMVGAVAAARSAGFGEGSILGFDMGGTSTDVFHWDGGVAAAADGGWERSPETEIGGLLLQAAMLPIHTVAAGGGSVLQVLDGRLQVGPRSAGADPGPACYRRGGPATVTDANLLLGRLPVDALPPVFGPGGDLPADWEVVRRRFEELAAALAGTSGGNVAPEPEAVAEGALTIAVERMAEAIRRISIQRGHDIRRAVLVSYGGAGGQHACRLAEVLDIERVLLHPLAGVLSAWGIGLSRQSLLREKALRAPLTPALLPELEATIAALATEARAGLLAEGDLDPEALSGGGGAPPLVRLELRYAAAEQGLEVPWALPMPVPSRLQALRLDFEALHRQRFGYVVEGSELVVERVLVEVAAASRALESGGSADAPAPTPGAATQVPLCLPDSHAMGPSGGVSMVWRQVPCRRRRSLLPGESIRGPAVVEEDTGTTVLEPGWSARVLEGGELLLERTRTDPRPFPLAAPAESRAESLADPVRLELYNHRFSAIAEQMGVRLQQCSRSVNIRERLDFSCALFDADGRLVANAPHIPVHLGSMGESVASLLAAVARGERPPLQCGDAVAANDPYDGGTHLPDITVITPVFAPQGNAADLGDPGPPLFFVACRGHHVDVGGITPGSMPPFSHRIEEEGLLLRNVSLLAGGRFDEPAWRRRLATGCHPVRNPDQLLADLQAQLAANRLGEAELHRLMEREGVEEVGAWMARVQANAAEAMRQTIERLEGGSHSVELDDGALIRVRVTIDRAARRARVDFSGTSPQQPGNWNAPLAITKAVVLYVFRCLVARPVPLNAGCFDPIDLVVPTGSLLHPRPPAAVVAGNVETSQAVANALFAALGVMAAAQGTMNNLSFGDERHQYYETICGGTGAGRLPGGDGFAGASAVQSHMTNSRLTDPEILEDRFPVRLERFALRRGSGGAGRWAGGNGVQRRLRFLAPMTVAILSGSRRVPPFGLAGGEPGMTGRNTIERADGSLEPLAGCAEVRVEPGDLLDIETPGGGGYGTARTAEPDGSP